MTSPCQTATLAAVPTVQWQTLAEVYRSPEFKFTKGQVALTNVGDAGSQAVVDSLERASSMSGGSAFRTTLWTEVLRAGDADSPGSTAALESLCQAYWYPLYVFVRRQGYDAHEAQDLTQAFFSDLLAKKFLNAVGPEKGRFRSYLLARLKNFLANEWTYQRRQKRGGGQKLFSLDEAAAEGRYVEEPRDNTTPETLYERRWAQTVLDQVFLRLSADYEGPEQARRFAELKSFLVEADEADSYGEVAARLTMSESAVKSAIHRLRQRYRELFRAEIANTVATSSEVDEEIRYLFAALRG